MINPDKNHPGKPFLCVLLCTSCSLCPTFSGHKGHEENTTITTQIPKLLLLRHQSLSRASDYHVGKNCGLVKITFLKNKSLTRKEKIMFLLITCFSPVPLNGHCERILHLY